MLRVIHCPRLFQMRRSAINHIKPIRNYHQIQITKSKELLSNRNLFFIYCILGLGLIKFIADTDKNEHELKSVYAEKIQRAMKIKCSHVDSMPNNMDASTSDGVIPFLADYYSPTVQGLSLSLFTLMVLISVNFFPILTVLVSSSSIIKDIIAGDAIFSSVNEFFNVLTNAIDYSFSGPTNALSYTPYRQNDTISILYKKFPHIMQENDKWGLCYGLTLMWYLNLCAGSHLLDKLKNIDMVNHQNLVTDILAIQRLHLISFYTEKAKNISPYRLKLTKSSLDRHIWDPNAKVSLSAHQSRMTEIKTAIEAAMANPGCLVLLVTSNSKKDIKCPSHTTGIMVDEQSAKYRIRYFDSNNHEAVFTDPLSAQISISRSQAYHYLSANMNQIGHLVYDLEEKPFLFWKSTTQKAFTGKVFNHESRNLTH